MSKIFVTKRILIKKQISYKLQIELRFVNLKRATRFWDDELMEIERYPSLSLPFNTTFPVNGFLEN